MRRYFFIVFAFLMIISIVPLAIAGDQQTSGVTAQTIIDRARVYLQMVDDDSILTDTQLLQFLNDGQQKIAAISGCMQSSEDITLQSGITVYSISTSYYKADGAIYNNSSGVTNKSLIKGDLFGNQTGMGGTQVQDPGEPVYWDERQGVFFVWPDPLSSVSGDIVTLYLSEVPSDRTIAGGTSVIATPSIYDKALVYYIVEQGMYSDQRFESGGFYEKKYIDEISFYREYFNAPVVKSQ